MNYYRGAERCKLLPLELEVPGLNPGRPAVFHVSPRLIPWRCYFFVFTQ